MPESARVSDVVVFDAYEVRLSTRELRKYGLRIKLPPQAFRVLRMLVERPGQLISREEFRQALWPQDTFVDFDQGLNTAVKKIRDVLNDSAENPSYIETLPRLGYRFIGEIDGRVPASTAEMAEDEGSAQDAPRDPVPAGSAIWIAKSKRAVLIVAAILSSILIGVWWKGRYGNSPENRPAIHSVAVLPLQNLSGDPDQEYFAYGMTEALITELGKIGSPRVISRQSVMQYKDSKKSLQEIARELNVDAILEGAVQRSGERVRVTVHLSQATPEHQLWAKDYDRSLGNVLGLQDEIAHTVVDEIRTKLTLDEGTRVSSAPTVNPEARDDYLRGRYVLGLAVSQLSRLDRRQYSDLDIQAAIGHFKHAIEKDAGYAEAYAGLADAYIWLENPAFGGHSPKETLSDAKAAARKALELDPSLAEAHFSLAQTLEYDWDWSEADNQYRLALKLNPNYVDAHCQYGRFVQALGRNDEAMTQMNYAMEVDPFGIGTRVCVAYVTYASRQYDLAVEQFERLGDDWGLIWAYREKKMYPEAIAAWERWKASHPLQYRNPNPVATIAGIYGLEGRKREAEELIDKLKKTARYQYVSGFFFAQAYLGLGQKDQAITWLERAYEDHDQWMVFINSYPGLDQLRSEPRFEALLRRMNFPQ